MMPYKIMFLENASKDLEVIYGYLKQTAGKEFALNEINALEAACDSLSNNPERGTVPSGIGKNGRF
jgi:plasmid stabilization system protein ParE